MLKKKFLTNLGFLLILNLLIKPIWIFGIDRTVNNIVAPGEYGLYFSIFNFTIILNILLDFGITNFNNRNIAQNQQLLNKHFSSIALMRLVLGLFYIVVLFIIALIIKYDGRHLYFLLFLGINQFLNSTILYLRSNISGLLMFRTDSFLSVLDKLIMILVCSILIWGDIIHSQFQIVWFIYAQTFAYAITAIIAFFIVVQKAELKRFNWNPTFFKAIFKQSLPFALLVLLMGFYNRVDAVMLERMLPRSIGIIQADIYAKAFRWLDAVNMIGYLFSVLLVPVFARLIKDKSPVNEIAKISTTILFTVSVIISIQSAFFSESIVNMLYHAQVNEAQSVFKVLILGFIPISATYVYGTLLTANGNLKALNTMAFLAVVLNIGLNLLFIPRWLALGSAYASLITQLGTAIFQIVLSIKIFKFNINKSYFIKLTSLFVSVIVINLLMKLVNYDWMIEFLVAGILSIIMVFALKLFNIKGIFLLFKPLDNKLKE